MYGAERLAEIDNPVTKQVRFGHMDALKPLDELQEKINVYRYEPGDSAAATVNHEPVVVSEYPVTYVIRCGDSKSRPINVWQQDELYELLDRLTDGSTLEESKDHEYDMTAYRDRPRAVPHAIEPLLEDERLPEQYHAGINQFMETALR